ncbi:MAG: hypothetical protein ACLF0P_06685 [Thermoanaerobaculia bacterium]
MTRKLVLALSPLLLCLPGPTGAAPTGRAEASDGTAPELPRGKVVERLAVAEDPEQEYALYVPSGYTAERPPPVLYLLDPRGRALAPMERFRDAAEGLGWVVASSWTSASDGPFEPNLAAMRAMWRDTHARLALDPDRTYAAGFSGTARAAVLLGQMVPGSLAGVVAVGAGFPEAELPEEAPPFLHFAAVGTTDFNYLEVLELEERLRELGARHRVEVFDGGHEWLPPEAARRALLWLELRWLREEGEAEIGDGAPVPEPGGPNDHRTAGTLEERFWNEETDRAEAFREAGDLWRAHRVYRTAVEDFAGLRDVTTAREVVETIEASSAFREERELRSRLREEETRALKQAERVLAEAVARAEQAGEGFHPGRTARRLGLDRWLERAGAEGLEGRMARRVVATLRNQTAFYLPRQARAQGKEERAAFFEALAARLRLGTEQGGQ